jgi:hypothetical protein
MIYMAISGILIPDTLSTISSLSVIFMMIIIGGSDLLRVLKVLKEMWDIKKLHDVEKLVNRFERRTGKKDKDK